MRLTFKYRLFPTAAQQSAFQAQLDACRWVYNKTLEVRRDAWQAGQRSLTRYDTHKMLTQWKQEPETEWLQQGHAQAMQEAQKRVDLAFRAFFRRVKEQNGAAGYPRFKSRNRYDSFTYPQEKGNWRFLDNGRLRLSKIGNVKIKLHRPLEGEVKTLTVRRDALGNCMPVFPASLSLPPCRQLIRWRVLTSD